MLIIGHNGSKGASLNVKRNEKYIYHKKGVSMTQVKRNFLENSACSCNISSYIHQLLLTFVLLKGLNASFPLQRHTNNTELERKALHLQAEDFMLCQIKHSPNEVLY